MQVKILLVKLMHLHYLFLKCLFVCFVFKYQLKLNPHVVKRDESLKTLLDNTMVNLICLLNFALLKGRHLNPKDI